MCHIVAIFFQRPRVHGIKDLGHAQRSLCTTHPHILLIMCAKYGKKIHSKLNAVEPTAQVVRYLSSFIAKLQLNGPEGIGQG